VQRPKPSAELAEELKGWCAKRGIGPEEIDSEELQAWCVKHKVDPTTARRNIEFAARHGGRSSCSGCEHCTRPDDVTTSVGDDLRDDVRDVWATRFTPLGRFPSTANEELESVIAKLDGDLKTLCDAVELARTACEARSVRATQEMLRHVADDPEALGVIKQQRQEHRENERKASVARMFALEIKGTDPGISMQVERVGGAGVVGELKPTASPITQSAAGNYPSLDEQFQARIPTPRSLWSALALDPPAMPTKREIGALKANAQRRHEEHDLFVATVDGLDLNSAERDAHRALQLRYFAAIARREWLAASAHAASKKHDDVLHRWERLAVLVRHLNVGLPHGRTLVDLARLILASGDDWTKPPCPRLVARWRLVARAGGDPERELAKEISRDLRRYGQKKASLPRKLKVRVAKPGR